MLRLLLPEPLPLVIVMLHDIVLCKFNVGADIEIDCILSQKIGSI